MAKPARLAAHTLRLTTASHMAANEKAVPTRPMARRAADRRRPSLRPCPDGPSYFRLDLPAPPEGSGAEGA